MNKIRILLGLLLGICFLFIATNLLINSTTRGCKSINYDALKVYTQQHKLSEKYAIVVDFNMPSGRHRFFVCDLKEQRIIASSLCAHGAGGGSTPTNPVFSNEVESNCSSLGHYKIMGEHKMNTSGLISFRLKGLDASNSNAERRGILIHSAKLVSKFRYGIYPFHLPLNKRISSGCFAVDIDMMDVIQELVKKESKPILLFVYSL